VLRLAKHEAVLARWYWIGDNGICLLWMCAAPSAQKFHELQRLVSAQAREKRLDTWQIVRGYAGSDAPSVKRKPPAELFLNQSLRERIEREVIGFFAGEVADLYRGLAVPYRRGVLLHGPPGNGKTSLIRWIGSRVQDVAAMLLRTTAEFDTDDLEEIIRRWTRSAPAILVIEDLNWLLNKVNVSTFLNLLDGVDSTVGAGGLLLIATSNHPDQLDGAINNRPGRFDVVIEMPGPDLELRRAFLAANLKETMPELIVQVAGATDLLSFAHLQEILRLSGLTAIHSGRAARSADDVLEAVRTVREARDNAVLGFPNKPEIPFGLLPLLERRKHAAGTL
jgi:SpoVK/Ycf46/Vps4 family AAA+-type ATPase